MNEEQEMPRIAILMAVYEPRMDWLRMQLESLESQTYPNLILHVRDDCSPTVPFEAIRACVTSCIHSFPYEIRRNERNLGSNLTFECLTREAEGEYFAYCDQDDIWLPEKLDSLQKTLEREQAELVCSDMFIIDGAGKMIADSITMIRRRHLFRSGHGLTDTLWYSNFASGCALLARASTAKAACPFNPYMYYDHYITLFSANNGKVVSLPCPLLYHREHGRNQSGALQGVYDKSSYIKLRVEKSANAIFWLRAHFPCDEKLDRILNLGSAWAKARFDYAHGVREQWRTIWEYRRFSPKTSLLEIALPFLPTPVFRALLWASRKNLL